MNDKQCWHFNNAWTCWVIKSKEQFDNVQQSTGAMRVYDEGKKNLEIIILKASRWWHCVYLHFSLVQVLKFYNSNVQKKILHLFTCFDISDKLHSKILFPRTKTLLWMILCLYIDKLSNFNFPFHFITSLHILT